MAVVWLFALFCRDAEETKHPKEKHDAKEKASGSRRANRFHPYKDKHGGEKKGAHRNRVFISNIPYDMKWQAIKDLMREKGNVPMDGDGVSILSITSADTNFYPFSLFH